jgi:prepilin-type N-terminal cleavage/methylation domain-containing protein
MTLKRGFTLIEVMLATTLTAILIGVTTILYAYTMSRLGHCLSLYASQRETENAMDPIDQTMRLAQTCSEVTANSATTLRCTMPQTCSDTNNDSIFDTCTPTQINRRGYERYGTGKRVWFYLSDSIGVPVAGGTILTMAVVPSVDSTPSITSVISSFGRYPGQTATMFDLISSYAVSNPSQTRSAQVSITAVSLTRNNTKGSDGESTASERSAALSRIVYSKEWRS